MRQRSVISVALAQNISTETQAQQRLGLRAFWPELCHRQVTVRSYGRQILGGLTGKPGGRMPAASLFTSPVRACDPQAFVDAKQEGSP